MARARNIKPGFFRNADLVELSLTARLLFVGLWTIADRAGRLEDRPKQIKMELFPADNVDVDACLTELASINVIERYTVEGRNLIQVVNFTKHQNPHKDEKVSTLPNRDGHLDTSAPKQQKHSASTVQAQCDTETSTVAIVLNPDSLIPDSLNPESLILNPEEETAQAPTGSAEKPKPAKPPAVDGFEEFWKAYPRKDAKPSAMKAFAKVTAPIEVLLAAIARQKTSAGWLKDSGQFIPMPATWLNNERWNDGATAAGASPDDIESRVAIEKMAFNKGLDAWDAIKEQWPIYKARVLRAPQPKGFDLAQLGAMASARALQ